MSEPLWARRALPQLAPDARTIGRWWPRRAADVTASRQQLAAAVHDGDRPPAASDGAAERLLLAFEELVSNAVRHGRQPVEATVTVTDHFWLLLVTDAAGEQPPALAVGRDAALGGLGLGLVAAICGAVGWEAREDGRKVVWARLDFTRDEAPGSVPQPRDGTADDRRVQATGAPATPPVAGEIGASRLDAGVLAAALEALPDGVAIFDREWTIDYVNPAGAALLGRPAGELVGGNIWVALPELGGTILHSFLLHARGVGEPVTWAGFYPPAGHWLSATAVLARRPAAGDLPARAGPTQPAAVGPGRPDRRPTRRPTGTGCGSWPRSASP